MGELAEREVVDDTLHGDLPPGTHLQRTGRLGIGRLPVGFDLHRVALSHGWCSLTPTAYDGAARTLHRTLLLPSAGPVTVSLSQRRDGHLVATWGGEVLDAADRAAVRLQLRRLLAVDDDLADLYAACARHPGLGWVEGAAAGRLLRSPTVFEDLVKTLATTNCSWALTRSMCRRLVESLGALGTHGERAFPTPQALARAGEKHLTEVVRAGYRARAFVELGERVASGELDPERWLDPALDDDTVLAEILALRGFGPYAAQGMLGFLGRPRGLALDSWVRAKLPRLLCRKAMTVAAIARRYAPLGRWAGMGLWLELTSDWFPSPERP